MASLANKDSLLVMALKVESQGLFEAAGFKPFYCGVGQVKATYQLTQWIQTYKPKHILNLGTVGSHKFAQGTLVECTSFVQRLPNKMAPMTSKIFRTEAISSLPQVVCGTGDFIETCEPVTACDVFDMEAYALAYVSEQMNIPFNSIKFVTDSSNENLIHDWKKNLQLSANSLLKFYLDHIK